RELARLERDVLPADGHADRGLAFGGNRHQLSSTFLRGRVGTRVSVVARRSLESPNSLVRAGLPPQSQFLDQCPVSLQVVLLQIVQEPPSAADELEQPAP